MISEETIKDLKSFEPKSIESSEVVGLEYRFFEIGNDDNSSFLGELKEKSWVTSSINDIAIKSLEKELAQEYIDGVDTDVKMRIEGINRYNNALKLIEKGYLTSAMEQLKRAKIDCPTDVDIVNLYGLLLLINCKFKETLEVFLESVFINDNEVADKYISLIASDEYDNLMKDFNHIARFISEDNLDDAISLLEGICQREKYLIEPYRILVLLYTKLGNNDLREVYVQKVKELDKSHDIIDNEIRNEIAKREQERLSEKRAKERQKKFTEKILPFALLGVMGLSSLATIMVSVGSDEPTQTVVKEVKLDKETENLIYEQANEYKDNKKEDKAIEFYKVILEDGSSPNKVEDSLFNIGRLSEELGVYNSAIEYYNKYINKYAEDSKHYEEVHYRLAEIYHAKGNDERYNSLMEELKRVNPASKFLSANKEK